MARLSDIIEDFIKEMLDESEKESIEIKRNELANTFNCAPSQINYVLSTRFSVDNGYTVESRRGGGGHIRIIRLQLDKADIIASLLVQIGDSISLNKAASVINFLYERQLINEREMRLMVAAINGRTLIVDTDIKNALRASVLKAMVASLIG